ncbi:MAG: nucleotidyl transferase AbiEii/AbiGii toxin family protein [bacterium]
MIRPEQIRGFFPPSLREEPAFQKYMLKEYIQLLILDYLSNTEYVKSLVLIGGTNLRLIGGIDRFSEDLDFDCKNFSQKDFTMMTDELLVFLKRFGFDAVIRDKQEPKLTAFRRNYYFPGYLLHVGLSAFRDERFLIKVECQDQLIDYTSDFTMIKGCGFFFPFKSPPLPVLCAMKLSALFSRQKGRDFYDAMFLMPQHLPDFSFLKARIGIGNLNELKSSVSELLTRIDLSQKAKDFEHLLFNKQNSKRILAFGEFVDGL